MKRVKNKMVLTFYFSCDYAILRFTIINTKLTRVIILTNGAVSL